jgi:putative hemolysin
VTQPAFGDVIRSLFPLPMPGPVSAAVERVLGIPQVEHLYTSLTASHSRPLTDGLLHSLQVTYTVSERDLGHIPRSGPAVVVSNHPFGLLDGAILASLLLRLRPDVKFLANQMLCAVPEIRELLIPIDAIGANSASANGRGLRQALEFLHAGGLLVVFPAGQVAHFQWRRRASADPQWKPAVARLISIAGRRLPALSVIPAYVGGHNSTLFNALGMLHPRLRTAWLVRELLNKRCRDIEVRLGQSLPAEALAVMPDDDERIRYLRWRTHLLAHRNRFKPDTTSPLRGRNSAKAAPLPIADPVPAEKLAAEVASLTPLIVSRELAVHLAPAASIPAVLQEIGRLREIAFRGAGEGTGRPRDLDAFDNYYLHLFVWNTAKHEVVGAYRLGQADLIEPRFGPTGLYTATLFRYRRDFLDRLGPALELGRSFIRPEYQRAFAPLLLLWKGIGRFVAENPRYRILFGPVSISNHYQSLSRQIMVSFLERNASLRELAALVSSRNPLRPTRAAQRFPEPAPIGDVDHLSAAVADIEPAQAGVPVLLRQYLKLGGKLLAFNVDPEFSGALDGLILVDLTKTEPKLLERYLGAAQAAQFLEFHNPMQRSESPS